MPDEPNVLQTQGAPSDGGGVYSTAEGYLRFAQMPLNEDVLEATRILSHSTVKLLRMNHLPEQLQTGNTGIGCYCV